MHLDPRRIPDALEPLFVTPECHCPVGLLDRHEERRDSWLRWEQVDLKNRVIILEATETKTQEKGKFL